MIIGSVSHKVVSNDKIIHIKFLDSLCMDSLSNVNYCYELRRD